jgi:hypothetical protein
MEPTNPISKSAVRVSKNCDECRSAHFLRYAMLAANLTPKISELEIIAAIGGHCPNYIQRALLSANVQTIQEALSFLNTGGRTDKTQLEPRTDNIKPRAQPVCWRYRPRYQPRT